MPPSFESKLGFVRDTHRWKRVVSYVDTTTRARTQLEGPDSITDCVQSLLELVLMLKSELCSLSSDTSRKFDSLEKLLEVKSKPDNIYSFCENTSDLLITDTHTLERTAQSLPNFKFADGCQYAVLEHGELLVTGGYPAKKDAVVISKDFKITPKESMLTGRRKHGLTYFRGAAYAISGWEAGSKCESYDPLQDLWQQLPDIPKATGCVSPIAMDKSLYVLGGYAGTFLNEVQTLDIEHNVWSVLQVKLPSAGWYVPCFSVGVREVMFVVKKQLWCLRPQAINFVKTLDDDIQSCGGPCVLRGETLHCSYNQRHSLNFKIGHLGWATRRSVLWVLNNKLRVTLPREVCKYL